MLRLYALYVYLIQLLFQLKWTEPDEEGLVKYLCGDRQFNEDRVRSGAKKILKSKQSQTQGRLDSFFKVLPSAGTTPKRKAVDDKKNAQQKKAKGAAGGAKGGRRPRQAQISCLFLNNFLIHCHYCYTSAGIRVTIYIKFS